MSEAIDSFSGDYEFLSNFSPHDTHGFGRSWSTVEHGFQAMKFAPVAGWAGVPEMVVDIARAETAGKAKRMGRTREFPVNPAWDRFKRDVMFVLVLHKFDRDGLREQLLATGDAALIEGNHWGDDYWGATWRDHEPMSEFTVWVQGYRQGRDYMEYLAGRNELGRILMSVREALR